MSAGGIAAVNSADSGTKGIEKYAGVWHSPRYQSAICRPRGVRWELRSISGYFGSSPSRVAKTNPEPSDPSDPRKKFRWSTTIPSRTEPRMFSSGA